MTPTKAKLWRVRDSTGERLKDSGLGFAEPGAQGHGRLRNQRTRRTTRETIGNRRASACPSFSRIAISWRAQDSCVSDRDQDEKPIPPNQMLSPICDEPGLSDIVP